MPKSLPEITIIRDTREQGGWYYDPEDKVAGKIRILGTEETALSAADYSIKGFEDKIRIERKNGFCELFGNMTPKENRDRFEREMEKLRHIPFKYILIESNLSKDIMGLSVGQMFKGPPCSSVMKWLTEIQMEYGINVMFVGDCGKRVARMIFESFVRRINE